MATTKDRKPQGIIDDEFLAGIKSADNTTEKIPAATAEPNEGDKMKPSKNPLRDAKKVPLNIKVFDATMRNWKMFCVENDITLTDAIKRAMAHYIKDVADGTIEP